VGRSSDLTGYECMLNVCDAAPVLAVGSSECLSGDIWCFGVM